MAQFRMTFAVAAVLRVFLDDLDTPRYGYELMRLTGFPSGKLYPILARLEAARVLIKETETVDPATAGRPARRMYRLDAASVPAIRSELAAIRETIVPDTPWPARLRPQGG
jgi:PadR family transcriptional regulator, regulatory protein PadR